MSGRFMTGMLVVGLTGGIATGKSTVSALLKAQDIPVIDADVLAREVVLPGTRAYKRIVETFGEGVIQADGYIDRPKLGAIVFNDEAKRKKLNAIVHPAVRRAMARHVLKLWMHGERVCVLDVPLLIESGIHKWVGKVVVVYCSAELQLQRLMKRDSSTREAAMSRLTAQMPITDKLEYADHVIENSGAPQELQEQFLQKLYEMVNDANNNELIRWADSGDSFFVLDHERFAREVLGRWFKHQNFASFVRQLNMYGFHKIPHLQQGVLKSDTDTELWNFEHPHFHRGQPDLLCLIQRKKQANQGTTAEEAIPEQKDAAHPAGYSNNAQVLDINSIINGIAAVKRHQQTISADLNELKNSNQLLWQEAITARERHKSHQDTINRILKFLASVFGRANTHDDKDSDSHTPSQQVVSRKRQRLMIDDGKNHKQTAPVVVDMDDERSKSIAADSVRFSPRSPSSYTIDTPPAASPAVHSVDTFSPIMSSTASTAPTPYLPDQPPLVSAQQPWNGRQAPAASTQSSNIGSSSNDSALGLRRSQSTQSNPSMSNIQTSPSSQDAVLQAAFQQLMHSPSQMQRFIQALSNSPGFPSQSLVPPQYAPPPPNQQAVTHIAPYDPRMEYEAAFPSEVAASASALLPKPDEGPALEPLLDDHAQLQKSYKDSAEIDADVDALQASINTLIENMGLDPGTLYQQTQPPSQSDLSANDELAHEDQQNNDFDLDAFLT
ncbi:hypothetical protein EWM64_g9825, partial [Hericium alpestre]